MKYLYKSAFILMIGASFALAQAGAGQGSQSTPYPSTQQPDNSQMGQASSAAAVTKAQSDIQSALRRQLPASADNVSVSVADNNKIQLSGAVSSDTEKQQVEQIAHTAAPNIDIDNQLTVSSNSPNGPASTTPPDSSQPPSSSKPPMLRLVAYQQTGSQPSQPTQTPGSTSPSDQSGSASQTSQTAGSASDVQDKIQKAIQEDSSLANSNISVNVADNKVELTGTVASKDQKKTAKQIAQSNSGGMPVVDHLKVSSSSDTSSPSTPPKN